MMNLEQVLQDYRDFLLSNYSPMFDQLSADLLDDWLQANWEIIVESRLQEYELVPGLIDVYGNGADCNGASSRVSLPAGSASCAVHISSNCILHSFGTLENECFVQTPPFDYVKGEDPKDGELVIALTKAKFNIGQSYDSLAT